MPNVSEILLCSRLLLLLLNLFSNNRLLNFATFYAAPSLLSVHSVLTNSLLLLVQVQIWASNKIHKEERSCMGKWDVQSQIMSSSDYYGPEKLVREDEVPRHVKFEFRNPVRCRILWITLRLQRPGSSSLNLGNLNLLSLDENPFAEVTRRASFGGEVDRDPCIHARRILVVGSPVNKEMADTSAQGSDQMNLKGWLERAPPLNRFRVTYHA